MAQQVKKLRTQGKGKYGLKVQAQLKLQKKAEKSHKVHPVEDNKILMRRDDLYSDVLGMRSCITLPFCVDDDGGLSVIVLASKEYQSAPWMFIHHRNSYSGNYCISEFALRYIENNRRMWGIEPQFTLVACGPLPTESVINHDRDFSPVAWSLMVCEDVIRLNSANSWIIDQRPYCPEVVPFDERTIERISIDQRPLLPIIKDALERTFSQHMKRIREVIGHVMDTVEI